MSALINWGVAAMSERTATSARGNGISGWLPVLFAAALFAFFVTLMPTIAANEAIKWSQPWIPSLGINLSFLVDGLSLTFALLISGIGTLVLLYSNSAAIPLKLWYNSIETLVQIEIETLLQSALKLCCQFH